MVVLRVFAFISLLAIFLSVIDAFSIPLLKLNTANSRLSSTNTRQAPKTKAALSSPRSVATGPHISSRKVGKPGHQQSSLFHSALSHLKSPIRSPAGRSRSVLTVKNIINGQEASPFEVPWMTSIQFYQEAQDEIGTKGQFKHLCGGVMITHNALITGKISIDILRLLV